MIFAKNILRFVNSCGNGIEFNALDALKRVDATHDLIHVANSKSWKAARYVERDSSFRSRAEI